MNLKVRVVEFCNEERRYLIHFDLEHEKLIIRNGSAYIKLKYGDTTMNIQDVDMNSLDSRTVNNLKIKFLDAIYNFNKSKTSMIKENSLYNY